MRIALLAPLVAVIGYTHEANATTQTDPSMSSPRDESAPPSAPLPSTPPSTADQQKTTGATTMPATPAPAAPTATAQGPTSEETGACPTLRVHFRFDSSVIEENQKPVLDSVVTCLQNNRRQSVVIEGNADERGSEAYNRALGLRRAEAVAGYLEAKGTDAKQVRQAVTYGEDNPLCKQSDENCWKRNRRTAIRSSCLL
jgi:peptidoglycan-associated lipoprotein